VSHVIGIVITVASLAVMLAILVTQGRNPDE